MSRTAVAAREQQLSALDRANVVRRARMLDKQRARVGDLDVALIFRDVPAHWASASVLDVLMLLRGVGRSTAVGLCERLKVSENRSLTDLTIRQREQVAAIVRMLNASHSAHQVLRDSSVLAGRTRRAIDDASALLAQAKQAGRQANLLVAESERLMTARSQPQRR